MAMTECGIEAWLFVFLLLACWQKESCFATLYFLFLKDQRKIRETGNWLLKAGTRKGKVL